MNMIGDEKFSEGIQIANVIFKTITTAIMIPGISELSKPFSFLSALLAALPINSLLIFIWIYIEQKNVLKIASMSQEFFFLVIPSLTFFLILPLLFKRGIGYYAAISVDLILT